MPLGGTTVKTVTIFSGQSQSEAVDIEGYTKMAILMPAAWTAAAITLLAAASIAGTYVPVHGNTGTEYTMVVAVDRVVSIDSLAAVVAPLRYIKLRSGNTATPVNQGADRILTLILKA